MTDRPRRVLTNPLYIKANETMTCPRCKAEPGEMCEGKVEQRFTKPHPERVGALVNSYGASTAPLPRR